MAPDVLRRLCRSRCAVVFVWGSQTVVVSARQNHFTQEEICALLGISPEDLHFLVNSRHIGRRAEDGSSNTLFDRNDLAVLAVLAAQLNRRGL